MSATPIKIRPTIRRGSLQSCGVDSFPAGTRVGRRDLDRVSPTWPTPLQNPRNFGLAMPTTLHRRHPRTTTVRRRDGDAPASKCRVAPTERRRECYGGIWLTWCLGAFMCSELRELRFHQMVHSGFMDTLCQAGRSSNTPYLAAAAVAEKMATKKSAYLICGMKLGREERA